MSNNKELQQLKELAILVGRLQELEETYHLIGTTTYYRNRHRVLKNQIENYVRKMLGLSSAAQPKKLFVFEVEEAERPTRRTQIQDLQASVERTLVTEEHEDTDLAQLASFFGIKVPNDAKDRQQYLLTEIQGFFKI